MMAVVALLKFYLIGFFPVLAQLFHLVFSFSRRNASATESSQTSLSIGPPSTEFKSLIKLMSLILSNCFGTGIFSGFCSSSEIFLVAISL